MTAAMSSGSLHWSPGPSGSWAVFAAGAWTVKNVVALGRLVDDMPLAGDGASMVIDLRNVSAVDTFGACLLRRLIKKGETGTRPSERTGLPERYRALLDAVGSTEISSVVKPINVRPFGAVEAIGRASSQLLAKGMVFVALLGAVGAATGRMIVRPQRFRLAAAVAQLDRVGFQAIPIILLITSLIGAIIAQQGIFNFRKFGAESYVVDLVGILVLRELGVLVVAIMVAGRSGSSYTAELGSWFCLGSSPSSLPCRFSHFLDRWRHSWAVASSLGFTQV
jgi:phospholipid/cholesterol/gamma-HCH transport system permease protein